MRRTAARDKVVIVITPQGADNDALPPLPPESMTSRDDLKAALAKAQAEYDKALAARKAAPEVERRRLGEDRRKAVTTWAKAVEDRRKALSDRRNPEADLAKAQADLEKADRELRAATAALEEIERKLAQP